jgi:hypothetical protein
LLSACSTYDLQHSSGDQKKRAVYQSELASDPDPYDYNDYAAYSVDTDVTEIMAYATDTTRFGNRSGSGNQSSDRIPYSEWIQLPEEQRNQILAKRKQERLENARRSQTSHPATRRANTHNVETYIDLHRIIDNAIMYDEAEPHNDNDASTGTTEGNNDLLAYMVGQQSSSGDICHVLAAKRAPDKQQKRQVNESTSAPPTLTMNGDTYYLNKGESIHYQGRQYFSHMTKCHYRVGQHDVADMEYALIDRGANGSICGLICWCWRGVNALLISLDWQGTIANCYRTGIGIHPQRGGNCHIPSDGFAWKRKKYLVIPSNGRSWSFHLKASMTAPDSYQVENNVY